MKRISKKLGIVATSFAIASGALASSASAVDGTYSFSSPGQHVVKHPAYATVMFSDDWNWTNDVVVVVDGSTQKTNKKMEVTFQNKWGDGYGAPYTYDFWSNDKPHTYTFKKAVGADGYVVSEITEVTDKNVGVYLGVTDNEVLDVGANG